MSLNLRLVRYLIAVVDEGHFGRAADRLYVSTPALSQQIRKLERSLGIELLDRSAHPVRPTPAGERFLTEAREALAAADRAIAAVDSYRREVAHTVRIGFMTASTGPQTREILDDLRRRVPNVTIQMVELQWSQQTSAVRDGKVDAALVRPPFADSTGLRLDVIRHESRVVALARAHPLADRSEVHLNELDDDLHVTNDDADPVWVRWWACDPRPSGVTVRYGPSVRTIDELLEVVAAGQAVSITGGFVADSHRNPGVVFVPVADVPLCPLSLCTRISDASAVIAELREAVLSSGPGSRLGRDASPSTFDGSVHEFGRVVTGT
ncbi:LysR family transcriptional regulator [Gordonia lacunae]|uniref:LysR family transcriptional regulator n=1 Tax=Gordonia lacunae TaxID=417102 RepID=A0A243Q736_9ACTN|nr:LysR family transcriptional regulator [Gordonia lacunae]OUC76309.1 LysR family transcriptional regulator [Gordonia lacunae]